MGESQEIEKKRGWGLTIAIPLGILGSIIGALTILVTVLLRGELYAETERAVVIWYMIQLGLIVVFLVGAWRWKRWGCFGLIALNFISALVSLIWGVQPVLLLGSLIGIAFLFAVYKTKEEYFD